MKLGTKLVLGVGVALLVVGALIAGLLIGRGGSDSQSSPDGREGSAQNVDGGGAAQDRTPAPTPNLEAQFAAPTTDNLGRVIEVPTNGMGVPLSTTAPGSRRPTDPDWLTAAPLGVRWQMTGGTPTALSTHDGPTHVDPTTGQTSGYSHTPQGAILAAQSIGWRFISPTGIRGAVKQATARTEKDRQLIEQIEMRSEEVGEGIAEIGRLSAPRGFRIVNYTDDRALILFYEFTRTPRSIPFIPIDIEWAGNDWRVLMGEELPASITARYAGTEGMTRW